MISSETAIKSVRRDQAVSLLLRIGFLVLLVAFAFFVPGSFAVPFTFMAIPAMAVTRIYIGLRTARNARDAAGSPVLIARGEFDQAEQQIETLLKSFWVFRSVKLMGLHHLAILRHAQRRYRDSALLSRALLEQPRFNRMGPISRTARLMLADSLIEMNDLVGAFHELTALHGQKLSLADGMNLLTVQLDYESRISAWPAMFSNIVQKVQLAELMPASMSARTQALLALSARQVGRVDWADWLKKRAELLAPTDEISANRPILKTLWSS